MPSSRHDVPRDASEDHGAEKQCAVGRKKCGCIVAAMVTPGVSESPDYHIDYGRTLRDWQRRGMSIEYVTVGGVRDGTVRIAHCVHNPTRSKPAPQNVGLELPRA